MSAGAQVAVLGARRPDEPARRRAAAARRPLFTLGAFALLGVYGVVRWATMLAPEPIWRLLGLVAVSVAIAALGGVIHGRRAEVRIPAVAAIVIGAVAVVPLSGFPLKWALHLRLAVAYRAIRHGMNGLPNVVVPYDGAARWTTPVIVLGAGLLLLGAALTLASARRPVGEARLAGAALPMVVLAIVPASLARPQVAYLQGALLFALLAALVFSERVPARHGWFAGGVVALAAAGALIIAPALDRHTPWINFESTVGTNGPATGETFDWSQTYGPLDWPQTGQTVLTVKARFADYWKAENLDVFDGTGWESAPVQLGSAMDTIPAAALAHWTETLTVSVRGLASSQVIAAGTASQPLLVQASHPGDSPGTFIADSPLIPGESYQVTVYAPEPTASQLALAGTSYPAISLQSEFEMLLPPTRATSVSRLPAQAIQFQPFGSRRAMAGYAGLTGRQALSLLKSSVYGPVYALARRLKAGAATPYEYVENVLKYLSHGFTYSQVPPVSKYPLIQFLLGNRLGYCQQFAGAMALLLRMGGIPARVADGFATGTLDKQTGQYVVSDLDAHAWVEAWFPSYGWVKFDPTPHTAPALGGPAGGSNAKPGASKLLSSTAAGKRNALGPAGKGLRLHKGGSGSSGPALPLAAALVVVVLAVLAFRRHRGRRLPASEALLVELERAFARCGRPLDGGVTLAELERRLSSTPDAAGYVRAIRLSRFSPASDAPSPDGRRAVRRHLRAGLGAFGWLRALLALPPGIHRSSA